MSGNAANFGGYPFRVYAKSTPPSIIGGFQPKSQAQSLYSRAIRLGDPKTPSHKANACGCVRARARA